MQEYTDEQIELMRGFNAATSDKPLPPSDSTGIFLDVPAEEYHRRQLSTASKTALDYVERSPAHYKEWLYGGSDESAPALDFGRAFHMLVLEPALFAETYAVAPKFGDLRYKENKARKADWEAENVGKLALSAATESAILGMHEAVMLHPAASRLILEGAAEATLRWKDAITGLACKSRADYWVKRKRFAVDLKSTEDASPDAFRRSVNTYGYHKQDALYRAGFLACGEPIDHFAIVAVEKSKPHAVAVYVLDGEAIAKGFSAVRRDIERLAECIARNHFPAYSEGIDTLSLPHWAA